MKVLKNICLLIFFLMMGNFVHAQNSKNAEESQKYLYTAQQQLLRIKAQDVRLIPDKENGGFHLYVRKTENVNSILLTETTKDPLGKQDNYAYRAKEYNPINGDEIRYLDGKPLISEGAKYSLVDSSVENTDFFGPAFHIYIPPVIVYGYSWSRNGQVTLGKGTFINIRSFEKPYADYSGAFMDSPFMFDLVTKKRTVKKEISAVEKIKEIKEVKEIEEETVLTDEYNPIASDKFKEISQEVIYSKGPETIIYDIKTILDEIKDKDNLDLVFAIDATGSMKNDLEKLKSDLLPALFEYFGKETKTRFGLLFYRDYGDTFKYMGLPVKFYDFTSNLEVFSKNLNSVKINGKEGGDVPEAVYEAMYAASEFYNWRDSAQKLVILIGDAGPHPSPRGTGKYSRDFVMSLAESRNIKIRSILLPMD